MTVKRDEIESEVRMKTKITKSYFKRFKTIYVKNADRFSSAPFAYTKRLVDLFYKPIKQA